MVNHIYNQSSGKVTLILTKPIGRVFTYTRKNIPDHIDFDYLLKKLSFLTEEDILPFVSEIEAFIKNGKGKVSYNEEDDALYFEGILLPLSLRRRYREMLKAGQDISPLEKFIRKLQNNRFKDIREELFAFMDKNDLPITEDGNFLAYKYVDYNHKDQYTHTIDNSVGANPSMKPEEVDHNRKNTCSHGLHFTSYDYAHSNCPENGFIMILEISPDTVMAIPPDYNEQKGRCFTYKVISEIEKGKEKIVNDYVGVSKDVKVEIPVSNESFGESIKEIEVKRKERSSIDFLLYDQATFPERKWRVRNQFYKGYELFKVSAGENWKDVLESEKLKNPEFKRLFELKMKMGVKPGREVATKDRVLMAVVSQGASAVAENLPKAKLLLPTAPLTLS